MVISCRIRKNKLLLYKVVFQSNNCSFDFLLVPVYDISRCSCLCLSHLFPLRGGLGCACPIVPAHAWCCLHTLLCLGSCDTCVHSTLIQLALHAKYA